MPGTASRSTHPSTGAVWRERLARAPGWHAVRRRATRLEVAGREFSLLPLASSSAAVASLCEPVPGGPLPDYALRRRIRRAIRGMDPRHLLLFVDGAGTERVWSWLQAEPGGTVCYREAEGSGSAGEPPLAALAASAGMPALAGRGDPEQEALARVVLRSVLRALGDTAPLSEGSLPQRVQHAVEETAAPGPLRAAWRALLAVRVVDPACGEGDRLLQAARLLEPPLLACLERMRVWVCEAGRMRPPPRRGRMGDFRRLVQRAGPPAHRRRWVREIILYHGLYGSDPDPEAVASCRRCLHDHLREVAPAGGPGPPERPWFNVRQGELAAGIPTVRELARRLATGGVPSREAAALLEEVELAARARRMIRRLHLEGDATAAELEAGTRSVHRWLDRLAARLEALLPERSTGGVRPLHGALERAGVGRVVRLSAAPP